MINDFFVFGMQKYEAASQITLGFYGRIYYATIIESGVAKANLLPCRRLSDNAIGWYDTVQGTFRSSSYYTAGPDVN